MVSVSWVMCPLLNHLHVRRHGVSWKVDIIGPAQTPWGRFFHRKEHFFSEEQRNVRNTNPVTIPPKKAFWNNLPSGTEEVRDEVPTVRYA